MNDNMKFNRRTVLKASGGLAGIQLAGSVSAESVNNLTFVEAGIWHQFDNIPDKVGRVHVNTPVFHKVGRDGDKLLVNGQMASDSTLDLLRNAEHALWSGRYDDLPSVILRDSPKRILVDTINDSFQPVTAVQTVNGYRPPRIKIETDGDNVTASVQGVASTVHPGERERITLETRSVVIEEQYNTGRTPVRITPVIEVINHGDITVSEVN